MMVKNQKRKLAAEISTPPLPGPHSDAQFDSVELSKIFTVLYPEIHEKSHADIVLLNDLMDSLFTDKKEGLLRGIEILTSPEVREHLEEVLTMVHEDEVEINDLKDIDVLLTKGKNEVLNIARELDLKDKCGRLYALINEDDHPT